jgi:hypothetical protein
MITDKELTAMLESRDFYELCQQYRNTKGDAFDEFEAIKTFLLTGETPWPSYDTDNAA